MPSASAAILSRSHVDRSAAGDKYSPRRTAAAHGTSSYANGYQPRNSPLRDHHRASCNSIHYGREARAHELEELYLRDKLTSQIEQRESRLARLEAMERADRLRNLAEGDHRRE